MSERDPRPIRRRRGVDAETDRRYAALHAETGHKRTVPPTTETVDGDGDDGDYVHELELKFG